MEKQAIDMLCKCRMCPSMPESGGVAAFCGSPGNLTFGATDESGCSCSDCAVLRDKGLTHDYFCSRGGENYQSASG
jgi:hypothetical protein